MEYTTYTYESSDIKNDIEICGVPVRCYMFKSNSGMITAKMKIDGVTYMFCDEIEAIKTNNYIMFHDSLINSFNTTSLLSDSVKIIIFKEFVKMYKSLD